MNKPTRFERQALKEWVPLVDLKINEFAQRELNQARVDRLAAEFDPELIGLPTVSERDGAHYIVDGQHRVEAYKQWLDSEWQDQLVECEVYSGLTESEEADLFDRLNDVLAVHSFDRFRIRLNAERPDEVAVAAEIEKAGLNISKSSSPGTVSAVGTLRRIYKRSDADTLGRTLRLVYEGFGDMGLTGTVIDGVAHLCQRYGTTLDDERAVQKFLGLRGGINAFLSRVEHLKQQTNAQKPHCVAATAVEVINSGKGGKKLPPWWQS